MPKETADAVIGWFVRMGAAGNRIWLVGIVSLMLLAAGALLFTVAEKRLKRIRCVPAREGV